MASTVAKMTKNELKEMIESTVEKKLLQLLGDPDRGLVLKKVVKDRLLRQREAVAAGERGEPLIAIVRWLGLNRVHVSCPSFGYSLKEPHKTGQVYCAANC
jgi:hypothetical protein